jgi:hypothetical protein
MREIIIAIIETKATLSMFPNSPNRDDDVERF